MIYHTDVAYLYKQKSFTVVALVSVNVRNRRDNLVKRGIVITDPLRSKLVKGYGEKRLHSSIISLLLSDLKVKKVIICPDVRPVKTVINLICKLHSELDESNFKSLTELREEIGDNRYKSEADAFARNIRRSLKKKKNRHRVKRYFLSNQVSIISSTESDKYEILSKKLDQLKK